MPPEIAKHLYDVLTACQLLEEFTRGKSFADYQADALLRAGVERQFITIGEALAQAEKVDAAALQPINALRQIIGFRNVLVHGYAAVQHATVWGVVENDLAPLTQQVAGLLAQAGPP
jgi:uncharacterized protein with HEPN domain